MRRKMERTAARVSEGVCVRREGGSVEEIEGGGRGQKAVRRRNVL